MNRFDAIIVGGGIMGCCVALELAEAGLKVAIVEKAVLCSGASGVNAGSHSMQNKRLPLVPYAMRAKEMWAQMSRRLDRDIGYQRTGGLIVALTDEEAAAQEQKTRDRVELGVEAKMVTGDCARQIEPLLSGDVVAASYCASDGFADTLRTGRAFNHRLNQLNVCILEHSPVERIEHSGSGFQIWASGETLSAPRILLSSGAWLKELLAMVGVDLPVSYRLNQALVLDRLAERTQTFVGHTTGLLTLKQSGSGKVLLGGGWVAEGNARSGRSDLLPESIIGNLRLAARVIPALRRATLLRGWSGFEADVPDFLPLAGPVPTVEGAFVLGCVGGGYTIGPYIARLISEQIMGTGERITAFDPARFTAAC